MIFYPLLIVAFYGGVTYDLEQFLAGFIWTLIKKDDMQPILACFNDAKDAGLVLKKVILDFEHQDFWAAYDDIMALITMFPKNLADCKGMEQDALRVEVWA